MLNLLRLRPAASTASAAPDPLLGAQELMNKRQFAESAAAFQAILEKNPSSPEANTGLIRSLLRGHKFDEADEAVKKAVAAAPSSAMVHAAAGDVAFRAGRFAETETEYRAALKLDPKFARAQFGMGRMYQMVSMNKRAKETFAKAHELDPDDRQITEYWLETLPYAEQLEIEKKAAGDHPTKRRGEQNCLYFSCVLRRSRGYWPATLNPLKSRYVPYGKEA